MGSGLAAEARNRADRNWHTPSETATGLPHALYTLPRPVRDRPGEVQMLFGLAVLERKDAHVGSSSAPLYRSDRLPEMQTLLAALADVATESEIAREQLERWSGTADE